MFIVSKYQHRLVILITCYGISVICSGQNLVTNPGFETIISCPPTYGVICNDFAPPWMCGNGGSADLFNSCGDPNIAGVPANLEGFQYAHNGEGYAGFLAKWIQVNRREYLLIQLVNPLNAGIWYDVSFYLSLAEDSGCGIEQIGAYFSPTSPYVGNWDPLTVVPQIESNYGYINDQQNWTLFYGCFQAQGGEIFLTIGNFHNDANTPLDPDCTGSYSYYYIDDVSVEEGDGPMDFSFDLGGPEFACFSYTIDPGITGYHYIWEDGSNGPTLEVTESGIYNLTLTDGCSMGVDSIVVIIGGNIPPVDIGPEELILCTGDVYTISLDPNLSEYEWNDGSNDSEYSITTDGIYSVTLDDGCNFSSDTIEVVTLNPPAIFTLGGNLSICDGDTLVFSLDPSLGDFLWQDNSTSSIYEITEGGVYALTISNSCGSVSDQIVVDVLEVPEIELGDDVQFLCVGEIIEIELDPSLGTILWQDGSTTPNYEISTPGIYTVYVSNDCGTGSDQIEVVTADDPVFALGADIQLCSGDTLLLDGDGINGDYEWQDYSSATSFTVTSEGTYSLTITTPCGIGIDSITVWYDAPVAPVYLGPDFSLCPGESLVLYTTSPGANYLWQDMSTADSLVVSIAGTYHVRVFNSCSSFSDTVTVSVNDIPPQLDLPANLNLCQGQTITLDAGISGVTYLWNDNSQNAQLNVSTPGTYSLTVTNACGVDMDTVIIMDGGPAPTVALGNDIDLCPGDVFVLIPTFSNVDTWLWHDGSSMPSFAVSSAGQISIEVSNSCGVSFDTIMVNLLPATPPLDLGPDTSLCSGQSFTLSINTQDVNILWSDGSINTDFLVSNPGLVFASIANSCGENSDSILINALSDIPTLNLGPDQSLCPGEIITLNPGIADVLYLWQDGSTNSSYQSTQQEIVILTITNNCGSSIDTLEILESTQGPQVDLGNDIQVCEGEVVTLISNISGVNYLWQDGSTNSDFTTTQSGIYILQVSNNCGTDADTIIVDISGIIPVPDLGPDTTLCEGNSLTLVSTADPITSVLWQDGSSASSFIVTTPGTYTLAESNRCGDASDSIIISFLDAPDPFTLGPDTVLCPGESIILNAPSTTFEIRWQDGSDSSSIITDQATTYSLQLSNNCGSFSDDLILTYDTRIPILDLGPDLSWCEGDVFILDATQTFTAVYLWSTGSTSAIIEIASSGLFSVEVSAPCAVASAQVNVEPGTDCSLLEIFNDLFIPNVFSPNNDNINDVFSVSFGPDLEVVSMEGSIFDRWGNLVFFSKSIPFTWDGSFAGDLLLPGVYVYNLNVTYIENGLERQETFSGDITLIR